MAPLHVPLFLWILVALLLIVVPPVIAPSYWTEGMEYEEELVVDEDDPVSSAVYVGFVPGRFLLVGLFIRCLVAKGGL